MEQGRLVDAFSSREMKRLTYMTERRIRYASSKNAIRYAHLRRHDDFMVQGHAKRGQEAMDDDFGILPRASRSMTAGRLMANAEGMQVL